MFESGLTAHFHSSLPDTVGVWEVAPGSNKS